MREAVAFLDARMREIRDAHRGHSKERIAVIAALNLAHEFRRGRDVTKASDGAGKIDAPAARRRIAIMRSAIDQTISSRERLL